MTASSAALAETRSYPDPDVPHLPLRRTLSPLKRIPNLAELQQYLQREVQRNSDYFSDLRSELADRQARAVAKGEVAASFEAQRQALDCEEQAQLADLRHKLALRVQIKLLNVLHVIRPKLRLREQLIPVQGASGEIEIVFDPALLKIEEPVCPVCARPTGAGVDAFRSSGLPGVRDPITQAACRERGA